MTIRELHTLFLKYPMVCTDTRNIQSDCIFFALKGEKFNGNTFAREALKKGAVYAVVDEPGFMDNENMILVENVLETLQELATYHRKYFGTKIIGLTGSNGKTTTKELINTVLSKKYRTISTKGNLNNHIGVPLTLLSITKDTEYAIVEMGANHQNEITFLAKMVQPDFGYITNFGKAHLEGFGSKEGVIKGKSELYEYLMADNKYIFLNADDPIQEERLGNYVKKIGFSSENHKYFIIQFKGAHPFVTLEVEDIRIQTQLIGGYNFTNCCAAVLMGKYFNVPVPTIKDALESYIPSNNRSQFLEKNGRQIILDAYNANPTSMAAALENVHKMNGDHKILFLGDMLELGETALEEHQQIVDLATKMNFDEVYLIGKLFHKTSSTFKHFQSFEEVSAYLKEHPIPSGLVLIKGSRGMALERVMDFL